MHLLEGLVMELRGVLAAEIASGRCGASTTSTINPILSDVDDVVKANRTPSTLSFDA